MTWLQSSFLQEDGDTFFLSVLKHLIHRFGGSHHLKIASLLFLLTDSPLSRLFSQTTAHVHVGANVGANADLSLNDTRFSLKCQCRQEGQRTMAAQNKVEAPSQGQIVVRSVSRVWIQLQHT